MTRIRNIVVIAVLALLAVPATGMASTRFGAKLTPDVQPSNANTPHSCDMPEETTGPCTRVLMIFSPPLSLGSPFQTATDTDGCWLLPEAVIK